jgi:hypothetical protein
MKLGQIRAILQPLLDSPPPDITQGKITEKVQTISGLTDFIKVGYENRYVVKCNIGHNNFFNEYTDEVK